MIQQLKIIVILEFLSLAGYFIATRSLRASSRTLICRECLIALVVVPIAGFTLRDITAFHLFLILLPTLLSRGRPELLACSYMMLLLIVPPLTREYVLFGLYIGEFSAANSLNIGALLALLVCTRTNAQRTSIFSISIWLLFLTTFAAAARGTEISVIARLAFEYSTKIVVPFYVFAKCVRSEKSLQQVFLTLCLGVCCNAVLALFEARTGWPLAQQYYTALGVDVGMSATLLRRAGLVRAQGLVFNSSDLAVLSGFGIVGLLATWRHFRPNRATGLIILMIVAAVASQSRGGMLGALGAVLVYVAYRQGGAKVAALATAILTGWFGLQLIASGSERFAELTGSQGAAADTADYRAQLFSRGLHEIARHPLLGQGDSQLQISMNDLRQGQHIIDFVNTPLHIALNIGVIGFFIWLAAWAGPLISAWRSKIGKLDTADRAPLEVPVALVSAIFISLIFTSPVGHSLEWTSGLIGIIAACAVVWKRKDRRPGETVALTEPAAEAGRHSGRPATGPAIEAYPAGFNIVSARGALAQPGRLGGPSAADGMPKAEPTR